MSALERADIQGNVLRGYGYGLAHARYLFAGVRDAGAARRWLAAQAEPVTTALEWDATPPSAYNLALSFAGLRALELPRQLLDSFPADFRAGMAERHERLGDVGDSAPERWEPALRGGAVHVLATVHAGSIEALADEAATVREGLAGGGLDVVGEQAAALIGRSREHFGFTDGFGQPAIADGARDAVAGQGVPVRWWPWSRPRADLVRSASDRRLGWRALAAGEFVLGYDDEDGGPPPAPARPSIATARSWCGASYARTSPAFARSSRTPRGAPAWRPLWWRPRSSAAGRMAARSSCAPTAATSGWATTARA